MKTHVIIHVLPHEIDKFEHQIFELYKCSFLMDKTDRLVVDATLNVNTTLFDWDKCSINKSFFVERFNNLKSVCSQYATAYFDVNEDGTCLGINDKRRNSIRKYSSECDNFIYLDCDVFYPVTILRFMFAAAKLIKSEYYIISPQTAKLWDQSWDILVNDTFQNINYNDLEKMNLFQLFVKDFGNIEVIPIPTFKFGGGWFNMLSSKLLKYIDIPDSLGPYGLDDTFIMTGCKIMRELKLDVQQYVLKNIVVSQTYMHEMQQPYLKRISFDKTKRSEFVNNAEKSIKTEITNFIERCKYDVLHNSEQK